MIEANDYFNGAAITGIVSLFYFFMFIVFVVIFTVDVAGYFIRKYKAPKCDIFSVGFLCDFVAALCFICVYFTVLVLSFILFY